MEFTDPLPKEEHPSYKEKKQKRRQEEMKKKQLHGGKRSGLLDSDEDEEDGYDFLWGDEEEEEDMEEETEEEKEEEEEEEDKYKSYFFIPTGIKVKHLLDCVNKHGQTPLRFAIMGDNVPAVMTLLKLGANPNQMPEVMLYRTEESKYGEYRPTYTVLCSVLLPYNQHKMTQPEALTIPTSLRTSKGPFVTHAYFGEGGEAGDNRLVILRELLKYGADVCSMEEARAKARERAALAKGPISNDAMEQVISFEKQKKDTAMHASSENEKEESDSTTAGDNTDIAIEASFVKHQFSFPPRLPPPSSRDAENSPSAPLCDNGHVVFPPLKPSDFNHNKRFMEEIIRKNDPRRARKGGGNDESDVDPDDCWESMRHPYNSCNDKWDYYEDVGKPAVILFAQRAGSSLNFNVHFEMLKAVVDNGADLSAVTSFKGHNVLHAVVQQSFKSYYLEYGRETTAADNLRDLLAYLVSEGDRAALCLATTQDLGRAEGGRDNPLTYALRSFVYSTRSRSSSWGREGSQRRFCAILEALLTIYAPLFAKAEKDWERAKGAAIAEETARWRARLAASCCGGSQEEDEASAGHGREALLKLFDEQYLSVESYIKSNTAGTLTIEPHDDAFIEKLNKLLELSDTPSPQEETGTQGSTLAQLLLNNVFSPLNTKATATSTSIFSDISFLIDQIPSLKELFFGGGLSSAPANPTTTATTTTAASPALSVSYHFGGAKISALPRGSVSPFPLEKRTLWETRLFDGDLARTEQARELQNYADVMRSVRSSVFGVQLKS